MKTHNRFYSVGSVTMVVALLLIQGATISATGGRVSSTIHSHGYNVNSNTSRAYSANVTYPNNERDMDVVSAASDRDDITWWQQDCVQSLSVASFPFYDGFESGTMGSDWTISTTNQGRVQVSSSYFYTGTYSLLLDDALNDSTFSIAAAILTVDLSGQAQVELDFWWREFADENHAEDGVFISDDNGAHWYPLFSFNDGPEFWRHQIIDLDAAATAHGLTLNDHFQIKFQFYDGSPIPADGYAFDEVRVRAPRIPVPASFPYYNGFESGALGAEWITQFTFEGRVQVGTSYAYTGTYSLLLDDALNDSTFSIAAAILTVDLSGQAQVELDFWWREFADENHAEDGVFISDDNGAHWYQLFSFNDGPEFWRHQIVNLDAAAATQGLTLNDHFQIKFQFYDGSPIPADGYAIDEVQVRPNAAPTLAWLGDTNYQQDGLHPESGDVGDGYVYRIKYTDIDADSPDSVRVHVQTGGVDIAGSPFAMACASGDYALGVTCTFTKSGLEAGTDYTYYFVAQDAQGNPAVPTAPIDAPDVTITYRVYLPLIMKNAGPPAGAPILNAINDPTGYYQYTLSWSAVERATSYTLQEDDNASFTSPASVYIGPSATTLVYAPSVGTYYYRVNASNVFGESGWSNTQSVAVSVPPPPRPVSGHWSGTTNPGKPMSFNVSGDGTQWMSFTLSADWSGCEAYGTRTWTITGPGSITNNQFSYTAAWISFTGRFSSRTSASGTYHIDVTIPVVLCGPNGCWTCYVFFDEQSIWTATGP
jgi:hypothetical protein